MKSKICKSATFRIWIAGDYASAVQEIRRYVLRGLCVAVHPVDYIYTMGAEAGLCVTLINYPRYPSSPEEIEAQAVELGHVLCEALAQGSFTVEGPELMRWFSRRQQDLGGVA